MRVLWCVVVVLAIVVFLLALNESTLERFANDASHYAEQPLRHTLTYKPKPMLYIMAPDMPFLARMSVYRPTIRIVEALPATLQCTDAYSYLRASADAVIVTMLPDESAKALLFLHRGKLTHVKDLRGKRIGMLSDVDRAMATVVLECYDIHASDVTFVPFSTPDALLASASSGGVDAAAVFAHKNSPVMKAAAGMLGTFTALSYDDVSMAKVHIWVPFARKVLFNLSPPMPNPRPTGGTKGLPPMLTASAIMVDSLLYGTTNPNPNLDDVINYVNQPSKNGYYSQFFTFHDDATTAMRDYSGNLTYSDVENTAPQHFTAAPHESFADRDADANFIARTNIDGRHVYVANGDYYEFHVHDAGLKLDGVRLRVGDRVALRGQRRIAENGNYYVLKADSDTLLATAYVCTVAEFAKMDGMLKGDEVWIVGASSVRGTIAADLSVLQRPGIVSPVGPAVCFEDNTYLTKDACKAAGLTWDAPCKRDDACPYSSSDHKGGCGSGGFCEMPLGVTRKGYTLVEPKSRPYYVGCAIEDVDTCTTTTLAWE